jgi:hypothetical protein
MTQTDRRPVFAGLEKKELLILGLYMAMLCFTLVYYQQSEDEGQAWIIARTYGIPELLFHILRYLGHPALYYLLLWVPAHLGMPLTLINWPFAAIATFGIYLLLRYSPFPFYLRALLPFGFALGYQYAVVARSYVLFPCLGFLGAHFYREKPLKPLRMAICLALLANVSIHGTMVACGFAVAYAVRLQREKQTAGFARPIRRQILAGAALFTASIVFVAVCVWPPKYLDLTSISTVQNVFRRALDPAQKRSGLPLTRGMQPVISPTASATPAPTPTAPEPQATLRGRLRFTFQYPIATSYALAILFEFSVIALLIVQRRLVLLLPFALLTYFLVTVYEQAWHVELVWVTLIMVLWAAWDQERRAKWNGLQGFVAILFGLLAALHLPWTYAAIRYDMSHASYPAEAAAAYLRSLPPGQKIDGNGLAFRVLPYFPNFLFVDHGSERFFHAGEPPPPLLIADFNAERADVILLRDADIAGWQWVQLTEDGYSVKRTFCGAPFFPNRPIKSICLFALQK